MHLEDVRQRRIERLRPPRRPARGQAQLRAHLHAPRAVASLREADGARQQVLGVQLLPDLLRLLLRLPVFVRARAGDDLEARKVRQLAAHLVGDAVDEVVVLLRAEVLEREDGQAYDAGVRWRTGRAARHDDHGNDGDDKDGSNAKHCDETAAHEQQSASRGAADSTVRLAAVATGEVSAAPMNRRDEPIASPRERLDEPRIFSTVAECLAQLLGRGVETVIEVDKRVRRPQPFAQGFARHDLSRALQEHRQHLKWLLLQLQFEAIAAQLARFKVDVEGPEMFARRWQHRLHLRSVKTSYQDAIKALHPLR